MARETYEQYMTRRMREEERDKNLIAQYEDQAWREMEERRSNRNKAKIYESPDGGKTVYERSMGSNIRKIIQSPEEQKIKDYLRRDKPEYTTPKPDETYPAREDVPAELWGKNIKEALSNKTDMVNHPPHYNKGIETTTYINSWNMGFSQGNVIKYVTRYNLKHDTKEKQLEDLKKARWYLEDVIKKVESEQ